MIYLYGQISPLSDTPVLDTQVLLAHILGKPRAWVLAHPETLLGKNQHASLSQAVTRLRGGEPLPYVLGKWEFFGLTFQVTPAVLIPRPETELVVEKALDWLNAHPNRGRVVDVGTGSGCIAVSLARQSPDLRIVATDISFLALKVARSNAILHGLSQQIDFLQSDLLSGLKAGLNGQFDVICANPPYLPTSRLGSLKVYQSEPTLALDGGEDGLSIIRRLLTQSVQLLTPGGILLSEIDVTLSESVRLIAHSAFPGATIQIIRDLSGNDRLLAISS